MKGHRLLSLLVIGALQGIAGSGAAANKISGYVERTLPYANGVYECQRLQISEPVARVRQVTIEVRSTQDVTLATTSTVVDGTFSVAVEALETGQPFRLIVWAESPAVVVYDYTTGKRVGIQYEHITSPDQTDLGTIRIDASVDASSGIRRGLEIVEKAIVASNSAKNAGVTMPQVKVLLDGPSLQYDASAGTITVPSSEAWHGVFFHVYAHFLEDIMAPLRGVSPVDGAVCERFEADPAGVFSEGWAAYWATGMSGSRYFWGRWCDLELGSCGDKSGSIASNVAAVLWDLRDEANESFDDIAFQSSKIWTTLKSFETTNPTLQTFMAAWNDSLANGIECEYTRQKCVADTVAPTITSFRAAPVLVEQIGQPVNGHFTVSDSGGSGLKRAEVWRAPDAGGAPGTPVVARYGVETFGYAVRGPVTIGPRAFDLPPAEGTYWYGVRVYDRAGNVGREAAPTRITVGLPKCAYAISPPVSATVPGNAGTGSIQVTGTPAGCTGSWYAATGTFITLSGTPGGNGAGSWQVPYSYTRNPSTSVQRKQVISIYTSSPAMSFTLTQEAWAPQPCAFSITPASSAGAGSGGVGTIHVTGSPAGCTGNWSAAGGGVFLTLTGATNGSGADTQQVPYSYPQNPSGTATRQDTVTFSGAFPNGGSFLLTQGPLQATACSYAIVPRSPTLTAGWGYGNIEVSGSPLGCSGSWSVASTSFVTVGGQTGSGSGHWSVGYFYSQNPDRTSARQAFLIFDGVFPGGGTVTLNQPAPAGQNLTFTKPAGWSDKIVVSPVTGTSLNDVLTASHDLYADWAVLNKGETVYNTRSDALVFIDGLPALTDHIFIPDAGQVAPQIDRKLGRLKRGRHTISVVLDPYNNVLETDESDNEYTATFLVGAAAAHDFQIDGRSDILWWNRKTGYSVRWLFIAGEPIWSAWVRFTSATPDLRPLGVGDFGDLPVSFPEVLWRRESTGALLSQYNPLTSSASDDVVWPAIPPTGVVVSGIADFDGDGTAEVLMRDMQNGATSQWKFDRDPFLFEKKGIHSGGNLAWSIVTVRDFDGDFKADILWRNTATGMTLLWLMNGTTIRSSDVVHYGGNTSWTIAGAGDFDGDTKCDLLWRDLSTGVTLLWQMDGAAIRSSAVVDATGNQQWTIAGIGDFNGDGRYDILWREKTTGRTIYWQMNGAKVLNSIFIHAGGNLDWDIVGPVL